jgi:hypothetical protein
MRQERGSSLFYVLFRSRQVGNLLAGVVRIVWKRISHRWILGFYQITLLHDVFYPGLEVLLPMNLAINVRILSQTSRGLSCSRAVHEIVLQHLLGNLVIPREFGPRGGIERVSG